MWVYTMKSTNMWMNWAGDGESWVEFDLSHEHNSRVATLRRARQRIDRKPRQLGNAVICLVAATFGNHYHCGLRRVCGC